MARKQENVLLSPSNVKRNDNISRFLISKYSALIDRARSTGVD